MKRIIDGKTYNTDTATRVTGGDDTVFIRMRGGVSTRRVTAHSSK